ncbi:MAG TPA: succinate--CoA ligase subunit alpha [bacterium]
MGILLNRTSRVIVQGITGKEGSFHAGRMAEYGTRIVGGVTPGKGGTTHEGIPVFSSVEDAVRETGADVSVIFVPPPWAADAICEAAAAGIGLIVCITEGIPVRDTLLAVGEVHVHGARLIGPNCPGLITPAASAKVGIMPGSIHTPGTVGVISRSGTLTYEVVHQLTGRGLGQSTCVGIGGDPVIGTTFVDCLALFEEDPETEAIVLLGEIGGSAEEEAAAFITEHVNKPVFSFLAGRTAPAGKRMGHAGAVISHGQGGWPGKAAALREAGVTVIENPARMGETVAAWFERRGAEKPAVAKKPTRRRKGAGA